MKKVLFILILLISSICLLPAGPIVCSRETPDEPISGSTSLNIGYGYNRDRFYRFIFSDRLMDKDGNFEDLFESSGIDWITMSTFDTGRLKNDKPLYVYWMVDYMTPISKMTLEVPGPLTKDNVDTLDLYVKIDSGELLGGLYGYGSENAKIVYERDMSVPLKEMTDSVQLSLWTGDITGKTAGNYTGSLVLRVYGEN